MAEAQKKRCREEEEVGGVEKRFRGLEAEELINMLEGPEEERNVAEEDVLCGVMKSLEEEISSCRCSGNASANAAAEAEAAGSSDQMSYLLTASDDELGIPPSPSLIESPLYEPPPEIPCAGDGLWHFEEYSPNWAAPLLAAEGVYYDDYQERDFGGGCSLFELSEGEQALLPACAI